MSADGIMNMKGDPLFSHHISLRTLGVKVMGLWCVVGTWTLMSHVSVVDEFDSGAEGVESEGVW